jgi:predicted ATP-grasp superfamily ATP-dependent carboligase
VIRVGVVGGSARAAVHSLARAGFSAWAVDQFTDRDLKRVAPCALCPPDQYPDELPTLAAQFQPGPVLYTGALENHPHVVRALAEARNLWGNPPEVLGRIRDPFALFPALAEAGFATPRFVPPGQPCPAEGRWLRKPIRTAGGHGIRFAQPDEAPSSLHYFQEFIDGSPRSALYRGATLRGGTEQLIGARGLHAHPFAYCGNIGPLALPEPERAELIRLGRALVSTFHLREHWGIDYVLRDDRVYPLEVNPRYTGAVEVLEHGTGRGAFEPGEVPPVRGSGGTIGKAIYYAPFALKFPPEGPWDADLMGPFDPWRVPEFADVPEPTSPIEAGSPVFTFFASGSCSAEVRERLQSRAVELDQLFKERQS